MDKGLNLITEIQECKNMKHFLYDACKKDIGTSKTRFHDLSEVEIPETHKEFLMADYNDDKNRILIFCSPELRLHLCNVKEYFIDATFKSCPKPFTQLLSSDQEPELPLLSPTPSNFSSDPPSIDSYGKT